MHPPRIHSLIAMIVALACTSPVWSLQIEEENLISPMNGQHFVVQTVPVSTDPNTVEVIPDMGTDDDGCEISTGPSEYDYYIATCPFTYFSALTVEWDPKTGRFTGDLSPDFKEWVGKAFNADWQVDFNNAYRNAMFRAQHLGQPVPDRAAYVMTPDDIPIEKRYRYALLCYEKRGAQPKVLAKIALNGAWALRAEMQIPVHDKSLQGGEEELNSKTIRYIKNGERFRVDKWLKIYKDTFDKEDLSNEAYLLCGLYLFGFQLREGTLPAARDTLKSMTDRFQKLNQTSLLPGLVRARRVALDQYLRFLDIASANFTKAIADEEFTRIHLPVIILAEAECLRRLDHTAPAMDWYLCLSKMAETEPKMREDIRTTGRAPSPDSPVALQEGWIADRHIADLATQGVPVPDLPIGADKGLLDAILFQHLGLPDYHNPLWKPQVGGDQQDCSLVLSLVGRAVLASYFDYKIWPKNLEQLWVTDELRDRNLVNHFRDPVHGDRLLYEPLVGDIPSGTVVVATAKPVQTAAGQRYGAFLSDLTVAWSPTPLVPGSRFKR